MVTRCVIEEVIMHNKFFDYHLTEKFFGHLNARPFDYITKSAARILLAALVQRNVKVTFTEFRNKRFTLPNATPGPQNAIRKPLSLAGFRLKASGISVFFRSGSRIFILTLAFL